MKAACALALSLALAAPPPALWASFQAVSPRGGLPPVPPTAAPGADGWRAHLARPGVSESWGTFLSERFGADLGAPEAVAAAPAVLAELVRPVRPEEAATPEALQAAIEREAARHAVELVAAARAGDPAARARLEEAAPFLALFPEAARRELAEAYLQLLGPELRLGRLAARLLRERETGSGVFASARGTPPSGLAPAPEPGQVRAPRDPAASPRAVPAVRAPEPRGRWLKALLLAALLSLPGHDVRPHAPPPPAVPAAAQWKAWSEDGQHVAVRWRGPDGRLREDVGLVVLSAKDLLLINSAGTERVPLQEVVSAEPSSSWRDLPRPVPSPFWAGLLAGGVLALWLAEKGAALLRRIRLRRGGPRPKRDVGRVEAALLMLQLLAATLPPLAVASLGLAAAVFPPSWLGLAAAVLLTPVVVTLLTRLGFGLLGLGAYVADESPMNMREDGLSAEELASRRPADLAALVRGSRALLLGELHVETGHWRMLLDSLVEMRRAGLTHIVLEQGSGPRAPIYYALALPHQLQLRLLAALLGIEVVGIDDGPWFGDEVLVDAERNVIMAEAIARILAEDPRARVFFSVGDSHLTRYPTITRLLRDRGVEPRTVLVANARPPDAVAHDWVSQDIRAAGLQDEAFYVERAEPYEHDGVLHAPDSAGLWWLPRPWAALKRWAGAARYRLGRLIS